MQRSDLRNFFRSMARWIGDIVPEGLAVTWLGDDGISVDVEAARTDYGLLIPLPDALDIGAAVEAALSALSEIQDLIVEEVLWGVPWPAPAGSPGLPMPHVQQLGRAAVIGYRLGTEWVVKSPELHLVS